MISRGRLLKKSSLNWKWKLALRRPANVGTLQISALLSDIAFRLRPILAINFGWQWLIQIHAWDCFQALVQNTVWSWLWTEFEAVIFDSNWLEPKQTSFSWTGLRFRSPAFQYLHKIRSGTCWFVPMPDAWTTNYHWSMNRLRWSC